MVVKQAIEIGSPVHIMVRGHNLIRIKKTIQKAILEIRRIDKMMSSWKKNSELMKVNQEAGKKAVQVSKELFRLIEYALTLSKATKGAFDITFASMWGVWDFRSTHPKIPSLKKILDKKKFVSYKDVVLNKKKRTIFLRHKETRIGLGGIAKGYIIDMVFKSIQKDGYKNILVNIGGDLRLSGSPLKKKYWTIAIQDPRKKDQKCMVLEVTNRSIATSGDYERFFIGKDGKRYHHILDPRTGYPANKSRSATIFTRDATSADGLATSLFVLGAKKGIPFIDSLEGVEGMVISNKGKIFYSKGLKK